MIGQSVPVRVHFYSAVNRLETWAEFYRLLFKSIIASTAEKLTVTLQGGIKKARHRSRLVKKAPRFYNVVQQHV